MHVDTCTRDVYTVIGGCDRGGGSSDGGIGSGGGGGGGGVRFDWVTRARATDTRGDIGDSCSQRWRQWGTVRGYGTGVRCV